MANKDELIWFSLSAKFQARQERNEAVKSGKDFWPGLNSLLRFTWEIPSIRNVTHFTFIWAAQDWACAWLGLREGGGARACNLHIVLKAECMCSYELPGVWGLCLSWQSESVTGKANIHVAKKVKFRWEPCRCPNWAHSGTSVFLFFFLGQS